MTYYYFDTKNQKEGDKASNKGQFKKALGFYKNGLLALRQMSAQRRFESTAAYLDEFAFVLRDIVLAISDQIGQKIDEAKDTDVFDYAQVTTLWKELSEHFSEMEAVLNNLKLQSFLEKQLVTLKKVKKLHSHLANICEDVSDVLVEQMDQLDVPATSQQIEDAIEWLNRAIDFRKKAKLPIDASIHLGYLNLLESGFNALKDPSYLDRINQYLQDSGVLSLELEPQEEYELLSYQLLMAVHGRSNDNSLSAKLIAKFKELNSQHKGIDVNELIIENINELIFQLLPSHAITNDDDLPISLVFRSEEKVVENSSTASTPYNSDDEWVDNQGQITDADNSDEEVSIPVESFAAHPAANEETLSSPRQQTPVFFGSSSDDESSPILRRRGKKNPRRIDDDEVSNDEATQSVSSQKTSSTINNSSDDEQPLIFKRRKSSRRIEDDENEVSNSPVVNFVNHSQNTVQPSSGQQVSSMQDDSSDKPPMTLIKRKLNPSHSNLQRASTNLSQLDPSEVLDLLCMKEFTGLPTLSEVLKLIAEQQPLGSTQSQPEQPLPVTNRGFFSNNNNDNTVVVSNIDAVVGVFNQLATKYQGAEFFANILSLVADYYLRNKMKFSFDCKSICTNLYEAAQTLSPNHAPANAGLKELAESIDWVSKAQKRPTQLTNHSFLKVTKGQEIAIFRNAFQAHIASLSELNPTVQKQNDILGQMMSFVANRVLNFNLAKSKSQEVADLLNGYLSNQSSINSYQ